MDLCTIYINVNVRISRCYLNRPEHLRANYYNTYVYLYQSLTRNLDFRIGTGPDIVDTHLTVLNTDSLCQSPR